MKHLALVLLVGCGAAVPRPVALQPLGDIVALTEVTSDGEHIAITGAGLADVDINSRIELRVDRRRVEQIFVGEQGPSTPEVERVKARLQELAELTRRQQLVLAQLVENTDALAKEGPTKIPSKALQDANQRFESALVPLNDAIKRYAVGAGQPPSAYFGGSGTKGVLIALDEERRKVLHEAQALANSSGLRWRMQAVFANNKPVHLDNYDTRPDGPFVVVDKLVPQVTAREAAAMPEEAKQLIKETKSLLGLKEVAIHVAVGALRGYLTTLRDAIHDDFATLKPIVQAIPDRALAIKQVAAVKAQLDELSLTLGDLKTACSSVLDAIKRNALGDIALDRAEACIRAVSQHGQELLTQARSAGQALAALHDHVKENHAALGELLQPLTDLLSGLETVRQLQKWADDITGGWNALKQFLDGAAAASAVTWSDDQQTDHVLAEITDTTIDLRRTERKEADLLYFRPSIVKSDGSAVILGATHDLRVVRMGMYVDLSAAVAFADAEDGAWGPFAAAPGIVAAVHYHCRSDSAGARGFNAIRPGLGIHFLYPDLGSKEVSTTGAVTGDDPSFELGVGGTVTLFGDLLQVGVGYDLQVRTSYWYIGFGLDTLAKLGVRFSPGS